MTDSPGSRSSPLSCVQPWLSTQPTQPSDVANAREPDRPTDRQTDRRPAGPDALGPTTRAAHSQEPCLHLAVCLSACQVPACLVEEQSRAAEPVTGAHEEAVGLVPQRRRWEGGP